MNGVRGRRGMGEQVTCPKPLSPGVLGSCSGNTDLSLVRMSPKLQTDGSEVIEGGELLTPPARTMSWTNTRGHEPRIRK